MGERPTPISPEVIWGKEFRVPAIVGKGSGAGFDFSDLHLLRGWEEAIPRFKEVNRERVRALFGQDCRERGFIPGEVMFDSVTGVLEEITIRTTPVSRLYLADSFSKLQDGIYQAENVDNPQVAIILERCAVNILNAACPGKLYPYIDGGEPGCEYCSRNLKIPEEFLKTETPLIDSYYQRNFEIQASNIAGRFGLTLRTISFDQRGLLDRFEVEEGNACGYYLDKNSGDYYGHNVDTPHQSAALHGIGAAFINNLLSRKDT